MSALRTMLPSAKWYQYYINPFELIGLQGKYTSIDDIDSNQIKKLKKLLLQEIELEDGNISWMPSLIIDKAKALNVCNELHDKNLLEFHLNVFNDKPLLNFLSRGEHSCFQKNIQIVSLDFKQQQNIFNDFTVLILINQFNLVIAETIKAKQFSLIKQLFNCKHLVSNSNLHLLTKSTVATLNKHLTNLEVILNKAKNQDISWYMVDKILYKDALFNIINELPQDLFKEQQERILELLNAISVTIGNRKSNILLESKILKTAQQFSFKSKKYDTLITSNLQIITIHIGFDSLKETLNKAKYQNISLNMIFKALFENKLIKTIKDLPEDLFFQYHNTMLQLLNAIAVVTANKNNFTLAIQILKTAQNLSLGYGEIDQLIVNNLQIIEKNQLYTGNSLKGRAFNVLSIIITYAILAAIFGFLSLLFG